MQVVTRKIQLLFDTEDAATFQDNWKALRDLGYLTYKAANAIVMQQLVNDSIIDSVTKCNKDVRELFAESMSKGRRAAEKKVKELYGCGIENVSYRAVKEFNLPSYISSSLNKSVFAGYKEDRKEWMRGNRNIRTYKRGMPIPFMKSKMLFYSEANEVKFKWVNDLNFVLAFGRDRSNNRLIVERAMSGEYKICDSSIQIKDNKIFLLFAVGIPTIKKELNFNKCVGVDLGINVPAYVAVSEGLERQAIGSREGFLKPRLRIQMQRKSLQKALKYTKGGKGRKKKLARLEKLKQAEKNTVTTLNHTIAKNVIDFALKTNSGNIALENLGVIPKERRNTFILRNWSYFQLQAFIEYKAKKYGIKVHSVNPAYTSQKCHVCKEKGERLTQQNFTCTNDKCKEYQKEQFADFNAAKNIAFLGIEKATGAAVRPKSEGKKPLGNTILQLDL